MAPSQLCDISVSMLWSLIRQNRAPIHNAIGLSLVLSEMTKVPFGGRDITFSENPSIHIVKDEPFKEQVSNLLRAEWGNSTDFVKMFRQLILPLAVENKAPPEDIMKRVFVFSDIQFDAAQPNEAYEINLNKMEGIYWQTHQQIVEAEFSKHVV